MRTALPSAVCHERVVKNSQERPVSDASQRHKVHFDISLLQNSIVGDFHHILSIFKLRSQASTSVRLRFGLATTMCVCHHSGARITWRAASATLRTFDHRPIFRAFHKTQTQAYTRRLFSSYDSFLNLNRMSITKMPKYLTGDKQAIENFIDQFDVCTPRCGGREGMDAD